MVPRPLRDNLSSIGWDMMLQPTYQIWCLYNYWLWRYKRQWKM